MLGFLTDGQERYFFDLHRFNSELGHAGVRRRQAGQCPAPEGADAGVRARVAVGGPPETGQQVIEAYRETVAAVTERSAG